MNTNTLRKALVVGVAVAIASVGLGCPGGGGTAAPAAKPVAGDTVVARWSGASFYEGKLESVTADKGKVAWSDGSSPTEVAMTDVFAIPAAEAKVTVAAGDHALVKWSTSTKWYGAEITAAGEKIAVKYASDGSSGDVGHDKVIVIPKSIQEEIAKQAMTTAITTAAKAAGSPWKPDGWAPKAGDAVVAIWGASYYSGKVESVAGENAKVAWSDGSSPSDSALATMGPAPTADSALPAKDDYVIVNTSGGSSWAWGQVIAVGDGTVDVKTTSGSQTAKADQVAKLTK